VPAARIDENLAKRKAEVACRQMELESTEGRSRVWDKLLRRREHDLEARAR